MNNKNPYDSPDSDLAPEFSNVNIVEYRKSLIPIWIKIFGWFFIVFGSLVPFIGVYALISGAAGEFSLYGLQTTGSLDSPAAILILSLFLAHGISAYGLLFGKSWGVVACTVLAYISSAICLFTMLASEGFFFRLELIILVPYMIKLYKLKPLWSGPNKEQ